MAHRRGSGQPRSRPDDTALAVPPAAPTFRRTGRAPDDVPNRTTTMIRTARRTHGFTESVIREMTRVAHETGAINLAQGFPDSAAPQMLKQAACEAILADVNQYAVTWGKGCSCANGGQRHGPGGGVK
jgi:hypothetical protein